MDISKNLCEKLYAEVKEKLQKEFVRRGMTYRGSETSIWKLTDPHQDKTYFQLIAEEITQTSFSTTFNNMYLWRKMNESKKRANILFQEDYLFFFIRFLGYKHPQAYISESVQSLDNFFGIKPKGKVLVIQPIFDAKSNKILPLFLKGKHPREGEQTVDAKDTESLLEIINLFRDSKHASLQRVYDQEIIKIENDIHYLNDQYDHLSNVDCVFCIGFYSNYFFEWALHSQINHLITFEESPIRYRIRYYNECLCRDTWTDYYESNNNFDSGFLARLPIKLGQQIVNCYFICGIENKATRAMTSYLCQHWESIPQKRDTEKDMLIENKPFIMVFKVNKLDLEEIYIEKIACP
ncbi:MAG: hypothetical protein EAZ08_11600 [Cytophagales bacterium]|nr:MAG: hypothetical protein EAZ08_11600 [Cytophagales bacterium]